MFHQFSNVSFFSNHFSMEWSIKTREAYTVHVQNRPCEETAYMILCLLDQPNAVGLFVPQCGGVVNVSDSQSSGPRLESPSDHYWIILLYLTLNP